MKDTRCFILRYLPPNLNGFLYKLISIACTLYPSSQYQKPHIFSFIFVETNPSFFFVCWSQLFFYPCFRENCIFRKDEKYQAEKKVLENVFIEGGKKTPPSTEWKKIQLKKENAKKKSST